MTQIVLTTVRSVTGQSSAMQRLTALQPVIPVIRTIVMKDLIPAALVVVLQTVMIR
jgi:hypothetical protein